MNRRRYETATAANALFWILVLIALSAIRHFR